MATAGAESPVSLLPIVLGYCVQRVLGTDATGIYVDALQEALDRPVTIKFMHRDGDAAVRQQFEQEVHLCTKLKHPSLLSAIDSGEVDHRPYLVTESIRLPTLAHELKGGQLIEEKRAVTLALHLARALQYLDSGRLIYRNLQPAYVLLPDQAPRLLTYRQIRRAREADGLRAQKSQNAAYCAPELVAAELGKASIKANVYALGALLYQMLAGKPPLEGPDASVRTAHAHALVPPLRTRRPGAPERAERLVSRLMTPDPEARPSPTEAVTLLEAYLNDPFVRSPLRSRKTRRSGRRRRRR